jgi:hypothetical protein
VTRLFLHLKTAKWCILTVLGLQMGKSFFLVKSGFFLDEKSGTLLNNNVVWNTKWLSHLSPATPIGVSNGPNISAHISSIAREGTL